MRKLSSIILVILFIGFAFIWFLYSASSHKVSNETHLVLAFIEIVLFATFAVVNHKWNILRVWILMLVVETLIIYRYNFIQPECEPCLPNVYCEPCISDEQIILKYIGISIAVVFILLKMIQSFKNSAIR